MSSFDKRLEEELAKLEEEKKKKKKISDVTGGIMRDLTDSRFYMPTSQQGLAEMPMFTAPRQDVASKLTMFTAPLYNTQTNASEKISSYLNNDDDIAPTKTDLLKSFLNERNSGKHLYRSSIQNEAEKTGLDFFQRSKAFDDGYDFGDVTKTILGTAADLNVNVVKGAAGLAEGVVDLAGYGVAGVADLFGQDEFAGVLKKKLHETTMDTVFKPVDDYLDKYSVLGRTSDSIAQGIGQVGAMIATGGLASAAGLGAAGTTAVTSALMGFSSMGSGMGEAYQGGATDGEAVTYGLIAGASDAISELIFGGLGKSVNALGLSTGLSSADDILAKKVSKMFSSQMAKNFAEFGIKAGAEGFEEVLAGVAQAAGKKATYMSEEEFGKILKDENLLEQFVVGAVTSGIAQANGLHIANKTDTDFVTGYNQNEQSVIDKVVKDRITEAEQDGKKVTGKEKSEIYDKVVNDMEKGYISTDTIEEVLGGDNYKAYQDTIKSEDDALAELAELYEGDELKAETEKFLTNSKRSEAAKNLSDSVFDLVKSSRLGESYREKARRGQKFEADLSKYDEKQRATVQKAVESGILNNTNRTHEMVDIVAKISADKGVLFDFTNNDKLKDTIYAVDGKTVNGFVTKDGITINVDSKKYINTVVGHEITHVLEGTDLYDTLQETLFEYAKKRNVTKDSNEYKERLRSLYNIYKDVDGYKGVEGFNAIKRELTADLVGDYLFTDSQFINNLSTNHRNVFQKIYDEVKYLVKVATAGSKEARELERVKKAFDEAYRNSGTKNTTKNRSTTYSLTGRTTPTYEEMTSKKAVHIVDVTGGIETGTYADMKSAVSEKASKEGWFDVPHHNEDTDSMIFLTEKSFTHAYSNLRSDFGEDTIRAMAHIPEVIRDARLLHVDDPKNPQKAETKVYTFIGAIKGVNGVEPVKLTVKEYDSSTMGMIPENIRTYFEKNGIMKNYDSLYDAHALEVIGIEGVKKEPDASGKVNGENPQAQATSDSDISVADLLNLVNGDARKYVPQPSVKYSLAADSNGRQLSDAQKEYFKDSKVVDENGNLKVMYHGTSNGGHTVFDPWGKGKYGLFGVGIYFTDSQNIAQSYTKKGKGTNPQVYESYLNIKNPMDMDAAADPAAWAEAFPEAHFPESGTNEQFYRAMEEYFEDEGYVRWEAEETAMDALQGMGYDGITHIGGGRVNADGERHRVYIAFEPEQVKNTSNKNPTSDPDIRYSLSELDNAYQEDIKNGDMIGAELAVERAANLAMANSKIRDKNGDLIPVYHGTKEMFYEFDTSIKGGVNGTAEGFGIYTSDDPEVTEVYGNRQIKMYANITKPATSTKKTISAKTLAALIKDTAKRQAQQMVNDGEHDNVKDALFDTWISNYVYTYDIGMERSYRETANEILRMNDNDMAIIQEVMAGMGIRDYAEATAFYRDSLIPITGFDGYVTEWENSSIGKKSKIILAFDSSQLKSADAVTYDDNGNVIPLSERFNPEKKDIRFSLSDTGETPKRYGNYNVSGQDIALETAPVQEEVAPVQEEVQTQTTEELFPDNLQPVQQELENLIAEQEDIRGAMEAAAAVGDYATVNQLLPEYDEVTLKVQELQAQESERTNTLTEADMPPVEEAPYPGETSNETVDNPFWERDWNNVGNQKVKAYMYENPEVKPFFQDEALALLSEFKDTTRGERFYNDQAYLTGGNEEAWTGVSRHTSKSIETLLDSWRMPYSEIEKGLNAIIEDNGAENIAAAKKIEFMLNDRLLNGYTDFYSNSQVPPNQDYINLLAEKQINEYSEEAFARFMETADQYAPPETDIAPLPTQPVVATETATGKGVVDGQQTVFADREIAPTREYEAVTPKRTKEPKMVRVDKASEESQRVAQILSEEPTPANKKSRAWARFKANVLDKGAVFEDLSLKRKNRSLMGKWNYILYSEARAQRLMGNGAEGVKSLNAIREEVANAGKTDKFTAYLYHWLNVDRMTLENRYEDTPNKAVFGDSVTADMSRTEAVKLGNENPEFRKWAQEVYKYNSYLRDLMVENGVISQETADLWAEMYPHYVPIRREGVTGLNIDVPLDTGRTGVNAPIKRATGGSRNILPLFDTMAQRTVQTYKAIAKNSFGVELKNTLGTTISNDATNVDDIIDSIDAQEGLLQKGTNDRRPTFTVFEDGEKVTFEITDDMYDALKPVSEGMASTNKFLNTASNLHRGVLTEYNPVFMLTNAIKDVQDVLINSQHPAKTYAKIPEAYAQMFKKGYWYNEYMENGGEQNTYFDKETNTFKTENKGIRKLLDIPPLSTISKLNNFIEMTPRLAEYIASREAGRSVEVAMLDAARVTTNFSAGGDLTKLLNRNGATFLNASIQGAMQQVRNVREAKANGMKGWVNLATKFAIAGLPALILNNLVWDDDDEYEELADYVKQNYYIVGKYGDGKFIRIPKGRTMAVIQSAFEQISNAATGNDEVDLKSFLELAGSNLAPNNPLENNILSPIFQTLTNTTWYGEDLVPTRLQDLPAAEQYDESTDSISKWLGEKLNISPYKINYLLDQYTGGVGDTILPMLTPEAESGDNSFMGNVLAPLKSKFTTDSTMNNQNVSDFYDTKDELTTNAKASTATDEDVLMSKYMNSINADLAELYAMKREYQNSSFPDDVKNENVRIIQEQIVNLTKESLNTYKDVNISGDHAIIGDRHFERNEDGEWQKLSAEQVTKYEVTSAAGDSLYATDGTNHYRWYEPGEDAGEDAKAGWRKVTEKELERQNEVTSGLGITPEEYWGNKEEYSYAYDNPENYAVAKAVGGYDAYKSYSSDLYDIKADKDSDGKSISGSRKEKVFEYIDNLDAEYGEKIILFKSEYPSDDTYNYEIIDYLNSREDISYDEMVTILKKLNFTVLADGTVQWD